MQVYFSVQSLVSVIWGVGKESTLQLKLLGFSFLTVFQAETWLWKICLKFEQNMLISL